jgi:hypothetical protein
MKIFLLKIFLIILIVFLLDKLVAPLLSLYIINKVEKSDFIIIGSSRAARNIIAGDLNNYLNLKCYNYGYPDSNIDFHYSLLELIIKARNIPKAVLLVLDECNAFIHDLLFGWYRWDILNLYGYYKDINEIFCERKRGNKYISLFLHTYKLKYNFPEIIWKSNYVGSIDTIKAYGSMPLSLKSIPYDILIFDKKQKNMIR